MKKSTINLIINNIKENKIKFEKFKYENGEITYDEFIISYKEEQKQKFELNDYNIFFENIRKLIEYLNKIEKNTKNYFSKINLEKELLIEIKIKEDITNNNIKIINSEYIIDGKLVKIKKQYQDKNILNDDKYLEGFTSFLKEIKNQILTNQKRTSNNEISTKKATINKHKFNFISLKKATIYKQKFNFISLKKVIGIRTRFAKKIWELDNDSFVSDGIIQYNIEEFNQIGKKNFNNYDPFLIDKKAVIISFKNDSISLSKKPNTSIPNIEELYPLRNLLKSKNDNYIIYNGTIYYGSDIIKPNLDPKNQIFFIISEMAYIGGIKLTDDYIAFTSNSILSKGENKLVFFNSKSKIFLEEFEIKNYSFTISENNCSIMGKLEQKNSKLLLVACKKYFKEDKNGILLVNLKFNEGDIKKTYQKFYDTKNFEVYCFCPLVEIKTNIDLNNDNVQKIEIETEYFLLGGLDLEKREGLIKLYKVIYYDEFEKIEIEFIHDIIIEKKKGKNDLECFKGFKGPISCIIQSPEKGILVTCYDGNAYLFSEPDLDKVREELKRKIF